MHWNKGFRKWFPTYHENLSVHNDFTASLRHVLTSGFYNPDINSIRNEIRLVAALRRTAWPRPLIMENNVRFGILVAFVLL